MTWSSLETTLLARAVARAPSVHHTQPWLLDIQGDSVDLCERPEARLPEHDPSGRDRMVSCGAALANLELAIRTLGKDVSVTVLPDLERPDLLAALHTSGLKPATRAETDQYSAIFRRRSYRSPFSLRQITRAGLRELTRVTDLPGVQVRVVDRRTESATLAELLAHAGTLLRDDKIYQHELEVWTSQFPEPLPVGSSLPWAGLVRPETRVPDLITLTQRLMIEGFLIFLARGDTRRDHLLAGVVMQRTWLTALTKDMVASVLTQPLRVAEVRAALIERLELAGYPQVILRVGYPAGRYMPLAG